MRIAVKSEVTNDEARVALVPAAVRRLVDLGAEVSVERGAGRGCGIPDAEFVGAGAKVGEAAGDADAWLWVRGPDASCLESARPGAIHIGMMNPFRAPELLAELARRGVSAISMEMVPRITRAQKMDVLSSQANLAGYVAVIVAAERLNRIFPMMMTAAGTIAPARVFVIGAGVAGLQAIATAKRLGARVEAFDTRPEVAEQVKSVGGKFLEIDLGETGKTQDGYAKALSAEQVARQREAMAGVCARSDVVITTAQVFGGKAPLLVTEEMLDRMKPGAVVVDLAVESGGNVAGVKADAVGDRNGVLLVGYRNLPGRVPAHASQVYAANLTAMIEEFWDAGKKAFELRPEDEIMKSCLLTHGGEIVNERFKTK